LCETSYLHCGVEQESNVAREGRIDAVADSAVDGGFRALLLSRGRKNEHVEVEEKPPKWGRIVDGSAVGVGGDDGPYDSGLEVAEGRFVAGANQVAPGGAEVRRFMVVDGVNEGESVGPVVGCMWGGVRVKNVR